MTDLLASSLPFPPLPPPPLVPPLLAPPLLAPPLLVVEGVSKSFAGLAVLTEFSFTVPEGAIVALVGPTGAGKTTLVNLIAGMLRPDCGSIRWAGGDLTTLRPDQVCAAGIARTFQRARPFGALSVEENVLMGAFARCRILAQARRRALEILALLDLTPLRFCPARSLTLEERIRLELARALATSPRLLVLDQGLTGLTPDVLKQTLRVLDALNSQGGLTIVLVEPTLHRVKALADHVIWLEHGTRVAEGPPDAPVPVAPVPVSAPTEGAGKAAPAPPEVPQAPETAEAAEAPQAAEGPAPSDAPKRDGAAC